MTDGVLNRAVSQFAERRSGAGTGSGSGQENRNANANLDDSMDSPKFMSGRKAEDGMAFVMPYAATLNVQKPAVPVLSSGKICYPRRPWPRSGAGTRRAGRATVASPCSAQDRWRTTSGSTARITRRSWTSCCDGSPNRRVETVTT